MRSQFNVLQLCCFGGILVAIIHEFHFFPRFHAILWPAILMAMGLPLPKLIIPHGHILVSGTKVRFND